MSQCRFIFLEISLFLTRKDKKNNFNALFYTCKAYIGFAEMKKTETPFAALFREVCTFELLLLIAALIVFQSSY